MESITFNIALAVSRFVKQAIPCSTDSRRILKPSERGCIPEVNVLMTNCTSPFSIMDNTFGSSEPIFATSVIGIPVFPTKRSEEHTSELQSRFDLVCRLLLEKKKKYN